ncbi:helix-hairpin-helix domain-containing protein [Macrococcoides canis]|uniref:Competence protein ComEA n=1 Tax=Macrococcoides canis TaxID=1855823 RepID=A0A4R6C7L4_9STAP|nr:helix-hairpin-helix domain-containing protein [Macrococcus canis]MEE1108006.1 helix-hairpin-helix domain-containing protein [Macrococcus canis]TDM18440.1 competence protein ComEA [Macrococcus canis]TDM21513.1 competence protein ComEA [Macrococcus canis]TDM23612.1 competence protein ComEA [Macrococcus canis]TDM31652.1 competence protein ComEA [Macrococcus canis]
MQNLLNFGAILDKYNVNKQMIGLSIVTFIVVLIVLLKSMSGSENREEEIPQPTEISEVTVKKEAVTQESAAVQNIKVDIKGAVKYSGVYDAQQGDRVHDVLKHAEVLPNADLDAVNLSQEVRDALVIYIPFKGEVKTDKYTLYQSAGDLSASDSGGAVQNKININQAEQSELEEIPGIGPKKAQDIIKYRTDNGGFKSIEEIKEIRGVGDKTYESLKDYIEV